MTKALSKPEHTARPLSPKLLAAVDLLIDQPRLTVTELAAAVGVRREHLSRTMNNDPRFIEACRSRLGKRLATRTMLLAGTTLERLMTAESEYVQLEAAKHGLAVNGVVPTSRETSRHPGEGIRLTIVLGADDERLFGDSMRPVSPGLSCGVGGSALPAPDATPLKTLDDDDP